MALENKKSDKYKELSVLVRKSVEKIERLRSQMTEDMSQFEEAEQTAILDKRKRLHYENIRIEEIKKEVLAAKESVLERIQAIEEKVFQDTKPLQDDKAAVDAQIIAADKEIEEIEALLQAKRQARE